MTIGSETIWLNYAQAAKRVGRSHRCIRMWQRQGMPMQWRTSPNGQRERIVDQDVLLAWFRDKLRANPAHQAWMQARRRQP
ncbi:hypothetical protein [Microbacterium arborescens]|uniref:hypothetical protein n=1 Tax=Microbacterium arborescens TaxID=33883 RepID=UPI0027820A0E|nr:hypothetical protein [Microbacterium arborescens]MDQ1217996.1 phage terminase Nu1 subunit (DNA packaging protein) [Microbacterium arborescens]